MSLEKDAHEFSVALRKAMDDRKVSKIGLAKAIGTSASSIYTYRQGKFLPTTTVAARIADALFNPNLLAMVIRMRTRACAVCGTKTVDQGTKPRVYCGVACLRLAQKGVSKTKKPDARDAAIGSFCQSCEPDGVCRTRDCPLRPFSPLPFIPASDVTPAPPSVVWTTERRQRVAERMGRYWGDPANRERQRERTSARYAAKRVA